MHPLETIEKEGFRAYLFADEDPTKPTDWDMFGTLISWHRRYVFEQDGPKAGFAHGQDFLETARKEGYIYIPVGLHDHSGITLYEGTGPHAMDGGGWDSGQVGFYYVTEQKALKEFPRPSGVPRSKWPNPKSAVAKELREKVLKLLRSELETWDQYVRGDVYYYRIDGPEGETHDSLGSVYGYDYALSEMKTALDGAIKHEREQAALCAQACAL